MKIKNLNDEKLVGLVVDKDKEYFSYIIDRYVEFLNSFLN